MASGTVFYLASIAPDMIVERDLVHHLSRVQCWGGNTDLPHYSMSQHALWPCRRASSRSRVFMRCATRRRGVPLRGLMTLEHRFFVAALDRFGVPRPSSDVFADVHDAEHRTQATEWRDVVKGKGGA